MQIASLQALVLSFLTSWQISVWLAAIAMDAVMTLHMSLKQLVHRNSVDTIVVHILGEPFSPNSCCKKSLLKTSMTVLKQLEQRSITVDRQQLP